MSRFLNKCAGTPAREVRTKLLGKRRALDELAERGYLKNDRGEYLPTLKLIAEVAPDFRDIGYAMTNLALVALRNPYIRNRETNKFPLHEIVTEVRRLSPGHDEKDVIPGLFLPMLPSNPRERVEGNQF